MKEWDEIKSLLKAYYEGSTSMEEERYLYDFFCQTDVPDEFSADKELFLSLFSMKSHSEVPFGLEARMATCIDGWEQSEQADSVCVRSTPRRIFLRRCMEIAAGLLLVFSVGTYLDHNSRFRPLPKDTCASPEEAYAEAQKALLLFSHSLNKGLTQVEKAEETTEKVRGIVEKHVNNLNN